MFDKIEGLLNSGKNKAGDIKDTAKIMPEAVVGAVEEEVSEIKDLNLTEVDQLQGDIIAGVVMATMCQMGIPTNATMRQIIATSSAYVLRDFKEGYTNPEKLIVMRVINKIRELREAKVQKNN